MQRNYFLPIILLCVLLFGGNLGKSYSDAIHYIKIINSTGTNVADVTSDGQLHVVMSSYYDTDNSTSTPLSGGATFTGQAVSLANYAAIGLLVTSDVASATAGLCVQYAFIENPTESDWYDGESYTIQAGATKFFTPPKQGLYYRVCYENGASAQSTFNLHSLLSKTSFKWSSHNINSNLNDDDDAQLVAAVLKLRTAQNTYVSGAATSNGNFKVSLEEFESGVSSNSNTQLNVTPFFSDGIEYQQVNGKLRTSSVPYLLDVAEGNVSGHTPFTKSGRAIDVDNTEADIWYGTGVSSSVYVFPTTAQQMEVVSSSTNDDVGGTGINSLYIEGLDSNYAEISETIELDGTTPVTTVNSYLRLNACRAVTAGSLTHAAGNILIQNTTNTTTYSAIPSGLTQCRDLIYTVPAGKTLYITSLSIGSGKGGNTTNLNFVIFTPRIRLFGSNIFYPQGELSSTNTFSVRNLEMPAVIPEKTDLKMTVKGDYASGNSVCIAAVRGWIE